MRSAVVDVGRDVSADTMAGRSQTKVTTEVRQTTRRRAEKSCLVWRVSKSAALHRRITIRFSTVIRTGWF